MLGECAVCGANPIDMSRPCPKCGSTSRDTSLSVRPGVLQLPQRRTPSVRDQIELQKQKTRHNMGIEGTVRMYFTWGELLEHRPVDIPIYMAPEGRAVIAVVFSRAFMTGHDHIELLKRIPLPFGLHVQAFLRAGYPVLRMNLQIPDDPVRPLWLESPLDVAQGNVQDFLEAAVEDDHLDLILTHETNLDVALKLAFRANELAPLLRREVRKVVAAIPPGGGHTDFLQAVTAMERYFPNPWDGIERENTALLER